MSRSIESPLLPRISPGTSSFRLRTPPRGTPVGRGLANLLGEVSGELIDLELETRKAARARAFADKTTESISALAGFVDEANAMDPNDSMSSFETRVAESREQLEETYSDDPDFLAEFLVTFDRLSTERGINLKRDTINRQIAGLEASLIKARTTLENSVATGDTNADRAVGEYEALLEDSKFALGELKAARLLADAGSRFVRHELFRFIETDPRLAIDYLDDEIVNRFLTPNQISSFRTLAEKARDDNDQENLEIGYTAIAAHANDLSLIPGTTAKDFNDSLNPALLDLVRGPGADNNKALKLLPDEHSRVLALKAQILGPLLDLAAGAVGRPNIEMFDAIFEAIPDNVEGRAAKNKAAATLQRRINATQTEVDVRQAIQLKLTLDKNNKNEQAVTDFAKKMREDLRAEGMDSVEVEEKIIDATGPTGIIPTDVVRILESIIFNASSHDPQTSQDAMDQMRYIWTTQGIAFTQSFSPTARAIFKTFERNNVVGISTQALLAEISKNMFPTDISTKEFNIANSRGNRDAADIFFAEFFKAEFLGFGVSIEAETAKIEIFGKEGRGVALEKVGVDFPTDMLQKYRTRFQMHKENGLGTEEAGHLAWEEVRGSFVKNDILTREEERGKVVEFGLGVHKGQNYTAPDIEFDMAAVVMDDVRRGFLVLPEGVHETPPFRELMKPSGTGERVEAFTGRKHDLIPPWIDYLTDHFTFEFDPGVLRDDGTPVYQMIFIDDEGIPHVVENEDGERYLIAPSALGGETRRRRNNLIIEEAGDLRQRQRELEESRKLLERLRKKRKRTGGRVSSFGGG